MEKINRFKTKASLTNYIRHYLYKYDIEEEVSGGHFYNLMLDLLQYHKDGKTLQNNKVKYFFVTVCHVNPRNRNFNLCDSFGHVRDFSYKNCIKNIPKGTFAKDCYKVYNKDKSIVGSFADFKKEYRT